MAIIRKSITGLDPDADYIFTLKPRNVEIAATDEEQEVIRVTMPTFDGTPSVITGLQLASNFQTVIFKFNPINDRDLAYFEYQLYDNESGSGDPINAVFSTSNNPVLISGTNGANVFLVSVDNTSFSIDEISGQSVEDPKRYWGRVRAVNISGNPSTQWSELVATGNLALIQDSFIANLTAAKITSGTIGAAEIVLAGVNSVIKSSDYEAGQSGWKITGFGDAEFNNLNIRTALDIGGSDSTSFHVDINGNMWLGAATFDTATNPFSVTSSGILRATGAIISGQINATSGSFTGTITSGYNLTTQFGNNINGAANHSGFKIGNTGWENAWVQRSDGTIYFNAQSRNVAPDGTPRGVSRLYIDDNNALISFNNGTFSVDYNGVLTASNANISGTINASAGTFSGTINATGTISGGTLSGAAISGGTITIGSNPGFRVNSSGDLDAGQGEFNFTSGQATLRVRRSFNGNSNKRLVIFRNNDNSTDVAEIKFTSSSNADFFALSDIRLKNILNETINATEIIKKIEPKIFTWKNDDSNNKFYGFIAQQIYQYIPHAVNVGEDDEDGNMVVSWKVSGNQVIPYLVKAIQELSSKVDELESKMIL
jgi:hypothetical protein